jgi:hypothetical protein
VAAAFAWHPRGSPGCGPPRSKRAVGVEFRSDVESGIPYDRDLTKLGVPASLASFFALEPDAHFPVFTVGRLDMNDARAAANGAIFRINLSPAPAQIHEQLVHFTAERAGYFGGETLATPALVHVFRACEANSSERQGSPDAVTKDAPLVARVLRGGSSNPNSGRLEIAPIGVSCCNCSCILGPKNGPNSVDDRSKITELCGVGRGTYGLNMGTKLALSAPRRRCDRARAALHRVDARLAPSPGASW